jgi:hypothetical protein
MEDALAATHAGDVSAIPGAAPGSRAETGAA